MTDKAKKAMGSPIVTHRALDPQHAHVLKVKSTFHNFVKNDQEQKRLTHSRPDRRQRHTPLEPVPVIEALQRLGASKLKC